MKKFLIGGVDIAPPLANIGLLLLRVFTGLALLFQHGLHKMPPSPRFVERVSGLGFPLPELFAWAAGVAETIGGGLLALGLLTRPASALILVTMLVAAFGRHAGDPFSAKELALLYGCVAFLFLLVGSARYGFDAVLRKRNIELHESNR
ncbi:DoxX family protein [candidate division KSB1 bacterium]|nr:DoxX family protein [candidate division KSB1 bacterium]